MFSTTPKVTNEWRTFRNTDGFLRAPILTMVIELCLWIGSASMVAGVILYWRRGGE